MTKHIKRVWGIAYAIVPKDTGKAVGLYLDREGAREFQRIIKKLGRTRIARISFAERT